MHTLERDIGPFQVTTHNRPIENRSIIHLQTHITHQCIITAIRNLPYLFVDSSRIGNNYARGAKRNLRQVKFTACQCDIFSSKFIFCQLLQLRRPNINRNPSGHIEIPHHRIYRNRLFYVEIVINLIGPNRPLPFSHHHITGHINRSHSPLGQNIFGTPATQGLFVGLPSFLGIKNDRVISQQFQQNLFPAYSSPLPYVEPTNHSCNIGPILCLG
ncbi:hypothetical protein ES703_42581 [subsurface metagenome]